MNERNEFGQFKKGLVPWNKGHKGIEKFPERHFPKQCLEGLQIYRQKQRDNVYKRFNESFVIDSVNSCWIWKSDKGDPRGYRRFNFDGKHALAHRFSYEMYIGTIPQNMTLDHLCNNPRCVNPLHLEPVTLIENVSRGKNEIMKNKFKTHCTRGHPYSGSNLYIKPNGERDCKTCNCIRNKKYLDKKRGVLQK